MRGKPKVLRSQLKILRSKTKEDTLQGAKDTVFRLLNLRARSEWEIRDNLTRKGFSKPVIDMAVRYFYDIRLINDREFAQKWISARLTRPFGVNRIRFELKEKGVDIAVIEEEIQKATEDYSEAEAAARLAQRQALKYKDLGQEKRKQRVYGYLMRRGFSLQAIMQAIKNI
jgi:regulatory protein